MKRLYINPLIIALSIFAIGCGSTLTENKECTQPSVMVDYSKVASINVNDAKIALRNIGISEENIETLKNDVALFHITYHSTYRGDSVILSGFVAMPDEPTMTDTLRHIHYNHGTLTPYPNSTGMGIKDTPTKYTGGRSIKDSLKKSLEARLFGVGLAGNGFMVTIPDYAGYGITEETLEHPYMYTDELAIEATDMLIAARELGKVLEFGIKDGVYLCGWSQGAALSLAQQRYMETHHPEIAILGNAALAGPYKLSLLANGLGTEKGEPMTCLVNWMIYSHLMFSGDTSKIKTTDIWLKPTERQYDAINRIHKKTADKIFTEKFLKNGRPTAAKLLSKSDLPSDWKPKSPVWLHHGTNDPLVDYSQSSQTIANMKKMGADSVFLITYTDGDHRSPMGDYFKFMVETFKK